jgi:hypothetical protein
MRSSIPSETVRVSGDIHICPPSRSRQRPTPEPARDDEPVVRDEQKAERKQRPRRLEAAASCQGQIAIKSRVAGHGT